MYVMGIYTNMRENTNLLADVGCSRSRSCGDQETMNLNSSVYMAIEYILDRTCTKFQILLENTPNKP